MTVVFVAGTGTEVGKTWVTVRLVAELQARGHEVRARKPAQSFAPDELGQTDADLLSGATGEPPTTVCAAHRWYETPMAPPMAAAVLGRAPFTIADLVGETTDTTTGGLTVVEGAGGPRSPLAGDGDNVDFARAVGARLVVLVADAGLGTINSVRLSTEALTGFETVVMLNRLHPETELHRRNRDWLVTAGYDVVVEISALADRLLARLS